MRALQNAKTHALHSCSYTSVRWLCQHAKPRAASGREGGRMNKAKTRKLPESTEMDGADDPRAIEESATEEALERQLLELEVLAAMYTAADEFATNGEIQLGKLACSITLSVGAAATATLHAMLPPRYPSVAATIQLSCSCLSPMTWLSDSP